MHELKQKKTKKRRTETEKKKKRVKTRQQPQKVRFFFSFHFFCRAMLGLICKFPGISPLEAIHFFLLCHSDVTVTHSPLISPITTDVLEYTIHWKEYDHTLLMFRDLADDHIAETQLKIRFRLWLPKLFLSPPIPLSSLFSLTVPRKFLYIIIQKNVDFYVHLYFQISQCIW